MGTGTFSAGEERRPSGPELPHAPMTIIPQLLPWTLGVPALVIRKSLLVSNYHPAGCRFPSLSPASLTFMGSVRENWGWQGGRL